MPSAVPEMIDLRLIAYLCNRAISDRFSGMALGRAWGIVQPLMLISTYYVVFSFGLKVKGNGGVDYAAWLISGLLPWLFFNEGLMAVTTSLKNNGALLKRLSVPGVYIHIASLAPAVVNHIVLVLGYVVISALAWELSINLPMLSLAFVYALLLMFVLGVVLSVFYVYVPDTIQVLQSVLNIFFWVTPVIWPSSIVSHEYEWLLTYNPMYFIVETYRRTLISGMPDFEFSVMALLAPVALVTPICLSLYRNIKRINDVV
jgi:ABC-type polysaccharide/polyol phosphate export permease